MNYELFSNLVKVAKEKHLPIKRAKYNKRKHKKSKWMTTALLNSINTKDRLHKIMIQSDWQDITFYNELKSQYKRYRAVLRKSIREAKRLYHIFYYFIVYVYVYICIFFFILTIRLKAIPA